MLAYGTYTTAGVMLNTEIPVVAVVSNSMSHQMERGCIKEINGVCVKDSLSYSICGKNFQERKFLSFDEYWKICGNFYENRNISKEKFSNFPIKNGFSRGDLLIIMGTDNYSVGDVVVYHLENLNSDEEMCKRFKIFIKQRGIDRVVHRIIAVENGEYIVKGDHNEIADQCRLKKEQFLGKVIFVIPKIGYLKIIPSEILRMLLR